MEGRRESIVGRQIQKMQGDWSDDELPDIEYDVDVNVRKRTEKKKQKTAQGNWSDDELPEIDFEYDVDDESEKGGLPNKKPVGETSKAAASKDSAASSSRTKYHCILSGHIFNNERIAIAAHTVGQLGTEKSPKCDDCKRVIVEKLWVCEIPVCGRRVCGTCKRSWDGERAKRARESWKR